MTINESQHRQKLEKIGAGSDIKKHKMAYLGRINYLSRKIPRFLDSLSFKILIP